MEQDSPGRSTQLRDEELNIRGARNVSKLEKLETERTQTTTSRSLTTDGHQGSSTHYANGDNSVFSSPSPDIVIDDDEDRRIASTAADESDEWRSRRTQRRSHTAEQRSGTRAQRYDAEERRSASGAQRSDVTEQTDSTRSLLSRRERNRAAAELAYRTAGLPSEVEYRRVSKRSKTVDAGGRRKPRGGLSETADFMVEDAMEQAIEAMYGKKGRAKTASHARTRSLDRVATTTTDRQSASDYEMDNRALGQTINETTSRDESRKKAVSYLRVEKDDEDINQDFQLQRPASADGRLTNRVDYAARRRVQAARRHLHAVPLKSRHDVIYTSPSTSRYQRRSATNLLASKRLSGYSSETELAQSSRRPERRKHHFSGGDSDFSTTVEVRSPRSTQFRVENGGYASDDDDSRNLRFSATQSRVPTLTKGMVTKILHGTRPRSPTADVSGARRSDVQPTTSPVQFSASPPPSISVLSPPRIYRDGQLQSAVVPVGSRSAFRPSAVDNNFLLQRAPAYQTPRVDTTRYFLHEGGGTGRSTPASVQTIVENDDWPPSSYAAFSNEPIIVADLDNDHIARTTSMRRAQSLVALDQVRPPSVVSGQSQTPIYSSRPDIRMTNRQVLNLYLFNRPPPRNGGKRRTVELETLTRSMTFDEELQNKQTQTPPIHRETAHHVTRQRNVEQVLPARSSKYIQTDTEHKPSKRRKPTASHVTEETVIMKPSFTETRETEIVGDIFADRHRMLSQQTEPPITSSSVTHVRDEPPQEEPEEEEILETTVVEEKEQRIEMTIREDLEFSLQRSQGTVNAVAGSTDEGKIEPWWIPDKFEAFVERKRQKVTQTKDIENKDDHSKRIDIDYGERNSEDNLDVSDSSKFEGNVESQSTSRHNREQDRNVRIPIFLDSRYNSPLHRMSSPSSNLVRTKMATHSEPQLNRRHQYFTRKRDQYYDSLFDDSRHRPFATGQSRNQNSSTSQTSKRQRAQSADIPELRPELVDDDASDSSTATDSRSSEKRYVSAYSQYISPPHSHGENAASTSGNDHKSRRSEITGTRASRQPAMLATRGTVFPTPNMISMPDVELGGSDCGSRGPDDDQLPDSLDHFDRVLAEIESDLPAPPPPPPLPAGNQRVQSTSGQHHRIITSPAVDTPPSTRRPTKSKPPPPPPEKSWKRQAPQQPKTGKLYSSQDRSANPFASGRENTASRSEIQSTDLKATDRDTTSVSSACTQQATGADFRHELGDHTYISLALTEPVQSEEQRRRIAVVKRGEQTEPGGFSYGWTSGEQRQREPTPGNYQLRHSRSTTKDFETAATAF